MTSKGNPLTQEIMNLYQEPDGTRRLLNYLLDNLASAIKRSKCVLFSPLLLIQCLYMFTDQKMTHTHTHTHTHTCLCKNKHKLRQTCCLL